MNKFKPGDVVRLKSGGPSMTIEKYNLGGLTGTTETSVVCSWFINNELKKDSFEEEALIRV